MDIRNILEGLEKAAGEGERAALRAMDQFGVQVLGHASQLCPVDTGALSQSDAHEPAEIEGSEIKKRIGFTVKYAAVVHERLDTHHPQGQAKYLETAVKEAMPRLAEDVAQQVKEALNG